MTLQNTIIHLIGFPGVGKLTIAQAICRQNESFLLYDNHSFNNLIFPLVRSPDGKGFHSCEETWDAIFAIRETVLDAMARFASENLNFVLTDGCSGDDPDPEKWISAMEETAKQRNALYLPVHLVCEQAEHGQRICAEGRSALHKISHDHYLDRWHGQGALFEFRHPNTMTLDVTYLAPEEAAKRILEQAMALSLRNVPQPALEPVQPF